MPAKSSLLPFIVAIVLIAGLGALISWRFIQELGTDADGSEDEPRPVPVEVVAIETGRIEQLRTYSGTLEAASRFRVAAKVGGRVARLDADLADPVTNGQAVATLDADEFEQALRRAQADLAVAQAELQEAEAVVEITQRALDRQSELQARGVASEVAVDEAASEHLAAEARVTVAEAGVARAQAAVATAETQLGYTTVRAKWESGGGERFVAERLVEVGDTVTANMPLLEIVEIDPLHAVMFVAERDYAGLRSGQSVQLRTDAYAGEQFKATVARISPVFDQASRQARIELDVPNPELRLRPGMFVRADTTVAFAEDAVIVPKLALTRRNDSDAVFVLDPDKNTARLVLVETGLTQADRVQVTGIAMPRDGFVVTLGQRFLDDGTPVRAVDVASGATAAEAP
ncbi:MAG: efflux RND transporter periplasmic adaptor subunit [Planctomycetota bacterium]